MTTDDARRAAIMYPKKVTPEAARPAPITGRTAAAAILYGGSKSGQAGSIDWALHSSFDRIEASVRGDAEKEKQVQATREKVRGLLTKANIPPSEAHTLLSIYREARETRRSEVVKIPTVEDVSRTRSRN